MATFLGSFLFLGGPFFSVWRGAQELGSWLQGVHGSWLQWQNAELSSLLAASSVVLASQKCLQSQGVGGPGRETQNCRRFWLRLLSSHLIRASHFLHVFFAFSLELLFHGKTLEFGL